MNKDPRSRKSAAISAALKGKPKSPEHVEKMRAASKAQWAVMTPEQRASRRSSLGSRLGSKHTVEIKSVIGAASRAMWASKSPEERAECFAKLRASRKGREGGSKKGRKVSEESKVKMRAAQSSRFAAMSQEERSAKAASMRGFIQSPPAGREMALETREKIANANRGRKRTDEARNRMCAAQAARWLLMSPEERATATKAIAAKARRGIAA
jgi:hypothetical protein